MELYQLRTFLSVADEGRLAAAAERLHVSQPAVSAHVKALEDELGVALFTRTPKGMALTEEGRVLAARAREVVLGAEALKAEAGRLRGTVAGDLRLGLNTDPCFLRIMAVRQALARHPELSLHILGSSTVQNLKELREGTLDAGFIYGDTGGDDLLVTPLLTFPLVLAAPVAWRERVEGAGLAELSRLPWIWTPANCPCHAATMAFLAGHGEPPTKTVVSNSEDMLREMVVAGAGLAFLREDDALEVEADGDAVLWRGGSPMLTLSFARQRRRADEPALKALEQAVLEVWALNRPAEPAGGCLRRAEATAIA